MAETREEVLSRNAQRFAKAYYDNAAMRGVPMVPEERKAFEEGEDAYIDWAARAIYAKMSNADEYSADNWNDAKAERLDAFKDIDGAAYALAGGKSPEQANYEKGWEKFRPLVENGEWYRLGPAAMTLEMTKLGYDNGDEKSRNQFWEDLRKYDGDYNRALSVDEFANSGWGKVNAVLNRTAYKEAMEQALGNKPYNEADVWTGFGIDRGRDALMAPAMAMRGVVAPALSMGGADMLSQYAGAATLGQTEFSPGETLSSMGAGATIVPGFRYGTRWLSRWKNPVAQELGKEMYRGAKNYAERDVVAEEANALKQQLLQARKNQRVFKTELPGSPKYDAAQKAETEMEDKLRLLGFTGDLKTANPAEILEEMSGNHYLNVPEGRLYSLNQMLGREGHPRPITDEQAVSTIMDAYNEPLTFDVNRPTLEQAARRLAGRNLGYSNDRMDVYQLAKQFNEEGGPELIGRGVSIPGGMETAIDNEAKRLIENGEAANFLDQILRGAAERRAGLEGAFPKVSAKYQNTDVKPRGRTPASVAGSTASNALGLLSGSEGIDLVAAIRAAGTIGDDRSVFQDKIDAFKQSDWYRNLPEDRKNVIDYAFKKAAEERKKKGKE